MINMLLTVSGVTILANIVYYGLGWIKDVAGSASLFIIAVLMLGTYIGLLKYQAGYPELQLDDPNSPVLMSRNRPNDQERPTFSAARGGSDQPDGRGTRRRRLQGYHVRIILVTQRPISAWFRGSSDVAAYFAQGFGIGARTSGRRAQHDRRGHRHPRRPASSSARLP